MGHLELYPFVELKAFSGTGTDEVSLSADVRHGQNREDNVNRDPLDNVSQDPLDNETLEAPHSSLNLLFSYFSVKCTHFLFINNGPELFQSGKKRQDGKADVLHAAREP